MTFDTWNEVWGSHTVGADAETQKLNYCSRACYKLSVGCGSASDDF